MAYTTNTHTAAAASTSSTTAHTGSTDPPRVGEEASTLREGAADGAAEGAAVRRMSSGEHSGCREVECRSMLSAGGSAADNSRSRAEKFPLAMLADREDTSAT